MKKVTLKDVAKRAGVSTTTVSMVLNGYEEKNFSEETRRNILNVCEELGYVRKHSNAPIIPSQYLAAIVPSMSNMSYVDSIVAMQQRALELGYTLLVFNTFQDAGQEANIMQLCNQNPIAGVIVLYPFENEALLQQDSMRTPCILHCDKDIYKQSNAMEVDGLRMGTLIGEHLYDLGHRRIAFVSSTFKTKQITRERRLEGLCKVFSERGLEPDECVKLYSPDTETLRWRPHTGSYELGYEIAKLVIDRSEDITAFASINDMIAMGIMDAVIDSGKKVPYDYSVCSCDNTSIAQYKCVSLTSVDVYVTQTGRALVDMIVSRINNAANGNNFTNEYITKVECLPKLIKRHSTGVPKPRKQTPTLC